MAICPAQLALVLMALGSADPEHELEAGEFGRAVSSERWEADMALDRLGRSMAPEDERVLAGARTEEQEEKKAAPD